MHSPAYLRERLRYDPETGTLWWLRYEPHPPHWNTRYAGTEAFTATDDQGYRIGAVDSHGYMAHRVIWAMHYNAWPDHDIDHEDRDKANNRIGNLRPADDDLNNRNKPLYSNNRSGVSGVRWDEGRSRWVARINVKARRVHLGTFASFDDAVAARKAAELIYDFHPSHGC